MKMELISAAVNGFEGHLILTTGEEAGKDYAESQLPGGESGGANAPSSPLLECARCQQWASAWRRIARTKGLRHIAEVGSDVFAHPLVFEFHHSKHELVDGVGEVIRLGQYNTQPVRMYADERCIIPSDLAGMNWLLLHRDTIIAERVPLGSVLKEHGREAALKLLMEAERGAYKESLVEQRSR